MDSFDYSLQQLQCRRKINDSQHRLLLSATGIDLCNSGVANTMQLQQMFKIIVCLKLKQFTLDGNFHRLCFSLIRKMPLLSIHNKNLRVFKDNSFKSWSSDSDHRWYQRIQASQEQRMHDETRMYSTKDWQVIKDNTILNTNCCRKGKWNDNTVETLNNGIITIWL